VSTATAETESKTAPRLKQRYDDMVANPRVKTLIGDAGATFSRFYAPFPLCCPARATLLRYASTLRTTVAGSTPVSRKSKPW